MKLLAHPRHRALATTCKKSKSGVASLVQRADMRLLAFIGFLAIAAAIAAAAKSSAASTAWQERPRPAAVKSGAGARAHGVDPAALQRQPRQSGDAATVEAVRALTSSRAVPPAMGGPGMKW